MYGAIVTLLGNHEKPACTSPRGFRLVVTMTYSGSSTKALSPASTTTRKIFSPRVSRMGAPLPPLGGVQVHERDGQQEQQQEHAHRAAHAEVPGQERGVVDVEADEVAGRRLRGAEQDVRGVEVVEHPQ